MPRIGSQERYGSRTPFLIAQRTSIYSTSFAQFLGDPGPVKSNSFHREAQLVGDYLLGDPSQTSSRTCNSRRLSKSWAGPLRCIWEWTEFTRIAPPHSTRPFTTWKSRTCRTHGASAFRGSLSRQAVPRTVIRMFNMDFTIRNRIGAKSRKKTTKGWPFGL